MLTDIRGNVGITIGYLVQTLDDRLRFYHLTRSVITQTIELAPLADLLPPGVAFPIDCVVAARLDRLDQIREHV